VRRGCGFVHHPFSVAKPYITIRNCFIAVRLCAGTNLRWIGLTQPGHFHCQLAAIQQTATSRAPMWEMCFKPLSFSIGYNSRAVATSLAAGTCFNTNKVLLETYLYALHIAAIAEYQDANPTVTVFSYRNMARFFMDQADGSTDAVFKLFTNFLFVDGPIALVLRRAVRCGDVGAIRWVHAAWIPAAEYAT
jgi:hypothetical protein